MPLDVAAHPFVSTTSPFTPPSTSRPLHPTMGQGVAERTYLRRIFTETQRSVLDTPLYLSKTDPHFRKWYVAALNSRHPVALDASAAHRGFDPETRWETWHEVAHRVALGNVSLLAVHRANLAEEMQGDYRVMADAIANGTLLMSGRHLQQGDEDQASRNLEVFSNCATAPTTFALFMLLLNGSGVGRDYSDIMMAVDWAKDMPGVVAVLDESHPDFKWGTHTSVRDAKHLYAGSPEVLWFTVPDTREGWGKAIEKLEVITYRNGKGDRHIETLVLDFSRVRAEGEPIMGMQGRPSSGPCPLMDAIGKITKLRGSGLKPWRATLYIDHYMAEPVLVGGARRSARMSTKYWGDADALEFIGVKRPIEFDGLTMEEVVALRAEREAKGLPAFFSFLWSSNNSIAVDADFWRRVKGPITSDPRTLHAKAVFDLATQCGYGDGNGEPGFINVDRLTTDMTGLKTEAFARGDYLQSAKFTPDDATKDLLSDLFYRFRKMPYHFITNPCGEIALCILGGFCVIADQVPCHGDSPEEAYAVTRSAVRALIRVNLMDSIWNAEVARTNRIGIGLTGVHEAAWKFFQVGFNELVAPNFGGWLTHLAEAGLDLDDADFHPEIIGLLPARVRAAAFWDWMSKIARVAQAEAQSYAQHLGVAVPHTVMTIKPSGSVSKLFGLTEGWHLAAMRHYVRWVQYHKNSPMLEGYRAMGYQVRELQTYRDHFIVGFPTEPAICGMGIGDALVTASEASMEDQFRWLRLGEFFFMEGGTPRQWIDHGGHGGLDAFLKDRGHAFGNQISYTMKYKPEETDYPTFRRMVLTHQPSVRCVSVMPDAKGASYEYLPEQQVSLADYQALVAAVQREQGLSEDVGLEHLDCAGGACPITFDATEKAEL